MSIPFWHAGILELSTCHSTFPLPYFVPEKKHWKICIPGTRGNGMIAKKKKINKINKWRNQPPKQKKRVHLKEKECTHINIPNDALANTRRVQRAKFKKSSETLFVIGSSMYIYDATTLALLLPLYSFSRWVCMNSSEYFCSFVLFCFLLLCGWSHEIAQRLNNADDKNGNEDDPRPKKELGRQISQRAWQMVRSSRKKKKTRHRTNTQKEKWSCSWKSFYILKSRCVSYPLVLFFWLYICFVFFRLLPFLNTDIVGRQHQLQQFDICGQRRGWRPVLDLPCRESRTTRLGHGGHFETRRPM